MRDNPNPTTDQNTRNHGIFDKISCMYFRFFALVMAMNLFFSCENQKDQSQKGQSMDQEHEYTNSLIDETSPYLLQHAHNPVDWYAWNEKTLELAKK